MVWLREPADLAGLIASGVIKEMHWERGPPEWMLKYAPRFSSHKADVKVFDNAERHMVELEYSAESIRRNRSRRAEVESVGVDGGRRYRSNDSGYYTASSGLLSTPTTRRMEKGRNEQKLRCEEPALRPSWGRESSTSSEGERRTLQRRSSLPELSSRFRVERDDELEADDEASQGSSGDDYVWDKMGPMGIIARVVETGRRVDVGSISSVDLSETGKGVL